MLLTHREALSCTRLSQGTRLELMQASRMKKEEKSMAKQQVLRIRLQAYDHQIIDEAAEKIVAVAKKTGAKVVGPVPLPTEKQVYTILRATFKYKDSREQFEIRTHKRLIYITNPTKETVELLRRLDLPSGVDIDVKL